MSRVARLAALCLAALCLAGGELSAQQEKRTGPDPKDWNAVVDRAVAYLKAAQAEDGSWSKQSNPGITPVVVAALLRTGKVTAQDPMIAKALKFIEAQADPETGALAGKGKVRLVNYLTSVNLTALVEADPRRYEALIAKAANFLKNQPHDESRGKTPKDLDYGGFGYDASTRADMSNTIFGLEALRTAKVPASDPVYRKVLVFVSRCQNLKGEHNDQPWAGKINDGSFIYVLGGGKKKALKPDDPRPGYGSITCSGLVALADCGVSKDDVRYKKALEWIQKNYTLDENPGTGGQRGYYLYLRMLATALERVGVERVTDGKGQPRDWRAEITAALRARQREDGSWVNSVPAWMESNPDLATSWALNALAICRPRAK